MRLSLCFRGRGEELQARGRRQDPEYYHGYEGTHENTGEEQPRGVRGDPGDVPCLQRGLQQSPEDSQAGCARRDLQVVRKNQHHRSAAFDILILLLKHACPPHLESGIEE